MKKLSPVHLTHRPNRHEGEIQSIVRVKVAIRPASGAEFIFIPDGGV